MGFRSTPKVTFDAPPTIDELIEGLQELRTSTGGDAVVRVQTMIEIHLSSPRVEAVTAEADPSR